MAGRGWLQRHRANVQGHRVRPIDGGHQGYWHIIDEFTRNALGLREDRIQGADLTQMTDKTAPRVTIIHHPDVRRALLTQKAYAEGLRALYLFTAAHQDPRAAAIVSGADADLAERVNDLLLPIVKGVGSERA